MIQAKDQAEKSHTFYHIKLKASRTKQNVFKESSEKWMGTMSNFRAVIPTSPPNGEERKTRLGRGGSVVGFLNLCIDYSIYVQQ